MEHKYADILRAMADDKDVKLQRTHVGGTLWECINASCALGMILTGHGELIRIAPKTICIGDMDVPEPMRVAPAVGTPYWCMNFYSEEMAASISWKNEESYHRLLKLGICHLKEADCRTHAEALIKVSGGVL